MARYAARGSADEDAPVQDSAALGAELTEVPSGADAGSPRARHRPAEPSQHARKVCLGLEAAVSPRRSAQTPIRPRLAVIVVGEI